MPQVFFHTFGCKVNQYETESLREQLLRVGYQTIEEFSAADLCIVNSCSVTAEADKKCRQFLRKILRENQRARVLVTGCYATRDPSEVKELSPRIEVFSNQKKDSIPEFLTGCSLFTAHASFITAFHGHTRAFVKVQDGCDAACTYCIIPKLRPKMESRPASEILEEVRYLLSRGTKEIVLTGIRLGSYGLASSGGRVGKVHGNLAELLKRLILLPGDFRIRLSSLEITELTDELIALAKSTAKICPHFHLPLQSGEDAILRRMGRWYDSKFYSDTVSKIRRSLPECGIFADVIVGFPGESDENFENSYRFIESHLNGMHVFPFSERAGTPAIKLSGHCDARIIQPRLRRMIALDKSLRRKFQNRFAGKERMVLAESDGGFTENGIRLFPPLPFPEGEMRRMTVPPPEEVREINNRQKF